MHLRLECIPCLVRHAYDISVHAASDAGREGFIREVLALVSRMDFARVPPLAARDIYDLLEKTTGVRDPFKDVKDASNRKALELYPWLEGIVASSPDPIDTALRVALAGNMVDYGRSSADGIDMRASVLRYLEADFAVDHRRRLREALEGARTVLYVLDNAGEIVLDRLLVEVLGARRVVCAVRSSPIINDATMDDARAAGLADMCRVIPSGSGASGTPLESCSDEFREVFSKADVVISKGQGNFETLFEEDRDIFHLFVAKCPVISREIGVAEGSALAFFNSALKRERKGD
ncbi:MAG TPA: ARMT1-like domain-containing protein [Deltaproteobacteria bacterium]|nr:ARMT1-like domain-containing protein [Deltaproteobacteria bacterium]HOM29583.1 ARMT1-like domain-containing protein [Deltaproteobacteria bacterium]HPP81159.1 ARMT1-like domain-containing protein [Deltaproteobacteria bacterium]